MISQVRLQQRYIAIKELNEEEALSIVLLCRVAGISRAAYYKCGMARAESTREARLQRPFRSLQGGNQSGFTEHHRGS